MKKRGAFIITAAAIFAAGIIGGTMAANAPEGKAKGEISTAKLGIEIEHSEIENQEGVTFEYEGGRISNVLCEGLPGTKVKDKVTVRNSKQMDAYVRVTINKTWSDAEGSRDYSLDPNQIQMLTGQEDYQELASNSNWKIESYDDGETLYCYYLLPVKAGSSTDELMSGFSILNDNPGSIGNEYAGYRADISFEADAIQKTAAKDAMLAEWGIEVEIGADGRISIVGEQ